MTSPIPVLFRNRCPLFDPFKFQLYSRDTMIGPRLTSRLAFALFFPNAILPDLFSPLTPQLRPVVFPPFSSTSVLLSHQPVHAV